MNGERIQFSMSVDPADKNWACVTAYGCQHTFINTGDMYAMALRYASYLTGGSLTYVRGGVEEVPSMCWRSELEHRRCLVL